MRRKIWYFCLVQVMLFGGLQGSIALAEDPKDKALTPADKAFIAWFDGLGVPDLSKSPFVRVFTGDWGQYNAAPGHEDIVYGFLISANEKTFTVFTLDLITQSFKKTPSDSDEEPKVYFEALDLKSYATDELIYITTPRTWEERQEAGKIRNPSGGKVYFVPLVDENEELSRQPSRGFFWGDRGRIVTLARACAAQTLDMLAHDLIQAVTWMPDRPDDPSAAMQQLKEELSEEISDAMIWRAFVKWNDMSLSRADLLREFRSFSMKFPESKHSKLAEETADLLEQMIREDQRHAKERRNSFQEMETAEQVSELIFQLRDQSGHQRDQPGSCNFFLCEDNSPAHKLVALGYEAIPQLLEALEDDRLTRSIGFHRDFHFSHHVLRVGDCAVRIIEKIADRKFYDASMGKSGMVKAGQAAATKVQIKQWWQECQ